MTADRSGSKLNAFVCSRARGPRNWFTCRNDRSRVNCSTPVAPRGGRTLQKASRCAPMLALRVSPSSQSRSHSPKLVPCSGVESRVARAHLPILRPRAGSRRTCPVFLRPRHLSQSLYPLFWSRETDYSDRPVVFGMVAEDGTPTAGRAEWTMDASGRPIGSEADRIRTFESTRSSTRAARQQSR